MANDLNTNDALNNNTSNYNDNSNNDNYTTRANLANPLDPNIDQ